MPQLAPESPAQQEAFRGEALGRLGGGAVDLPGHDLLIGVDIKPKLDNIGGFLISLLRWCGRIFHALSALGF